MSVFKGSRARALLGSAAIVVAVTIAAGTARADLSITSGGTIDDWEPENGQAMPSLVQGYVDGILGATAGAYTFTYGAPTLISSPPSTGAGDSFFDNVFWYGAPGAAGLAAAKAAGDVFCTETMTNCAHSQVGNSFTVIAGAGDLGFHLAPNLPSNYSFLPTATIPFELDNGTVFNPSTNAAAYLDTTGPVSTTEPNPGPSGIAYIGMSDQNYPGPGAGGDHDFQDLVVQVQAPEPVTLSVLGVGLAGLFAARRRRRSR